jgi:SAM-dependent methyltransferase
VTSDATPALDRTLIPPRELLFDGTSSEEEFLTFGENFCRYILIQRAYLEPDGALLDVGSGNGSVARYLTGYLTPPGRYEGLDIHAAGIAWLQEHYQAYPHFRFTHANVYNKMYNPGGQYQARDYRLPFDDGAFDMVMLKSVFTHMLPADLGNYLSEIGRVLKPGGRSVITYFLLNEESRRLIAAGRDKMGLAHDFEGDPLCRVTNPEVPEHVVAHDEGRIRDLYARTGFTLGEVMFGDWCGRRSLLGLQDFIVALKT